MGAHRPALRRSVRLGRLLFALVAGAALACLPAGAAASDAAATQFTAAYPTPMLDGGVSTWTCSGVHIANPVSVKDNEECLVAGDTSGLVAGTVVGDPKASWPGIGYLGWSSDFNGVEATHFKAHFVSMGGGMFKMTIQAYYS
jgi:hypothetical protein